MALGLTEYTPKKARLNSSLIMKEKISMCFSALVACKPILNEKLSVLS